MNYINKILLLIFVTFIIVTVYNKDNEILASTESEIAEKLHEYYGTIFGDENQLFTIVKTGYYQGGRELRNHRLEVNSSALSTGHLAYGTGSDARNIFGNVRWFNQIGQSRFVGVTVGGFFGFYRNGTDFEEEYKTAGGTANRRYLDWKGHRNIVTGTNHGSKSGYTALFKYDEDVPWNDPSRIRSFLEASNNNPNVTWTPGTAGELYNLWIDNLYDHYNNPDEFAPMSSSKKKALSFIIQPPTELTYGRMIEWHLKWTGSGYAYSNYLYDVYNINKLASDDFVATKVEYEKAGNTLNIYFTVKYMGKNDRELEDQPLDTFTIYAGGEVVYPLAGDENRFTNFPMSWKKGQSHRVQIATIDISSLRAGTTIETVATFNPDQIITEDDFNNNTAWADYPIEPQQACLLGGSGTSKMYERWECVSWTTCSDGEGNSWTCCAKMDCVSYYKSLSHDVSVLFNEGRQGLMGAWSSNSKGHVANKTKVPDAKKTDAVNEKWRSLIEKNVPH